MSLKKKLYNYIGYDFHIYKIINKYYIIEYEGKKFIYRYEKNENLDYNLKVLKAEIKNKFNFIEVRNCKYAYNIMDPKTYEKCRRECPYYMFCEKDYEMDNFRFKSL